MITGYGDVPTAVQAIKGGAVDFIEKPLAKEDFVRKVRTILEQSAIPVAYTGGPLTMAEMNVLRLIVDGKSNREIADFLHRSIRTVETHRAAVMHKFGVNSLIDLIKRVAAMGLVDLKTKQPLGGEIKAKPQPEQAAGDSENGPREKP
jgi:FixJ family two-component response regulator